MILIKWKTIHFLRWISMSQQKIRIEDKKRPVMFRGMGHRNGSCFSVFLLYSALWVFSDNLFFMSHSSICTVSNLLPLLTHRIFGGNIAWHSVLLREAVKLVSWNRVRSGWGCDCFSVFNGGKLTRVCFYMSHPGDQGTVIDLIGSCFFWLKNVRSLGCVSEIIHLRCCPSPHPKAAPNIQMFRPAKVW